MTYFSVVHADTPLHWWRLADPGGALAYDIGSSFVPLTYHVLGTTPNTGPSSDGGSALHSATARITWDALNVPLGNTWSLESWYWIPNRSIGDQEVMTLYNGAARLSMRDQSTGTLFGFIAGDGTVTSTHSPTLLAWNHAVLTYDHVTLRLYLNGALEASLSTVQNTTLGYGVALGDDTGPTAQLSGWLAEAAVYSYALSGGQVTAHYAAADQIAVPPIFLGGGKFDVTLGSVPGGSNVSDILGYVHKVY